MVSRRASGIGAIKAAFAAHPDRPADLALGYEDVNDHDDLRFDPALALFSDRLEPRRPGCAALGGKSTLNRLEHAPRSAADRYRRIAVDSRAVEDLFVDLFLEAHAKPPREIVLDLDATDDPLHGDQEGRFFHGYYDGYCYLPLYVFCGDHLLAAKLRRANIDASAGSKRWHGSSSASGGAGRGCASCFAPTRASPARR